MNILFPFQSRNKHPVVADEPVIFHIYYHSSHSQFGCKINTCTCRFSKSFPVTNSVVSLSAYLLRSYVTPCLIPMSRDYGLSGPAYHMSQTTSKTSKNNIEKTTSSGSTSAIAFLAHSIQFDRVFLSKSLTVPVEEEWQYPHSQGQKGQQRVAPTKAKSVIHGDASQWK